MNYCARLSTRERNCRLLNSESLNHSEILVPGRLALKRFVDQDGINNPSPLNRPAFFH